MGLYKKRILRIKYFRCEPYYESSDIDIFVELKGVVYSCAIVRDISEQKEANRIARLSDFTIQKAGDSIFWVSPVGSIKQVNENACKKYGYTQEEFLRLNVMDLYQDMQEKDFQNIWMRLKKEEQLVFETAHCTKANKIIPVEISSHYIQFEEMEYACSMVRDISERKQKEAAIRGALLEIKELKEKLEAENNYLQEEIEVQNNFGEIISSKANRASIINFLYCLGNRGKWDR